jgi:hypothetical protein
MLHSLPAIWRPIVCFDRGHARIQLPHLPKAAPESVLHQFERFLMTSGYRGLAFAKLQPKRKFFDWWSFGKQSSGNTPAVSVQVIYRAAWSIRLLAWVELYIYDNHWEWRILMSEVRTLRTPSEENSHFEYGPHQQERYKTGESATGAAVLAWDLLASNLTVRSIAKSADWFERLIKEAWLLALDSTSPLSHPGVPRAATQAVTGAPTATASSGGGGVATRPPKRI